MYYFNEVKCNLTELATRSAGLAFTVSCVQICACARIPRVLGPEGIQIVSLGQCFSQTSESQVQGLCSEVVPLPSLFTVLSV